MVKTRNVFVLGVLTQQADLNLILTPLGESINPSFKDSGFFIVKDNGAYTISGVTYQYLVIDRNQLGLIIINESAEISCVSSVIYGMVEKGG